MTDLKAPLGRRMCLLASGTDLRSGYVRILNVGCSKVSLRALPPRWAGTLLIQLEIISQSRTANSYPRF